MKSKLLPISPDFDPLNLTRADMRDVGAGQQLRQRLMAFVGLRISDLSLSSSDDCRKPT